MVTKNTIIISQQLGDSSHVWKHGHSRPVCKDSTCSGVFASYILLAVNSLFAIGCDRHISTCQSCLSVNLGIICIGSYDLCRSSPRSSYKVLKKDPTVNCRFPWGNCFHDKSLAISLDTGVFSGTPADDLKSALCVLLLPFICWDNYISPAPVFKIFRTDFTFCSQTVISLSDFINAL